MKKYLIAIILLVLVAGGGYGFYSRKNVITNTDNWKTYRSEQYGIELKYPSNLKNQLLSFGLPSSYPIYTILPVSAYSGESGSSLKAIYDQCSSHRSEYRKPSDPALWQEAIINGRRFCFTVNKEKWSGFPDVLGTYTYITKIKKDGVDFYVNINFGTGQEDVSHWNDYLDYRWTSNLSAEAQKKLDQGSKKLFESILATFRILPEPTSWQTYRNDQYGFELRLPKDFKDYKVLSTGSLANGGFLYFYATTSDKSWTESGIPKGYATLFVLRLMPIDKWNNLVKQCEKEGSPVCSNDEQVLAKINGYAIDEATDNTGILNDYNFGQFRLKTEYLKANIKPLQ